MKTIVILLIIIIVISNLRRRAEKSAKKAQGIAADKMHLSLEEHVSFYRNLRTEQQNIFCKRVEHFLDTTRITAVGDEVQLTDKDRLYVAAAAIIPIFYFTDWAYNNLDEVLLYADTFSTDFDREAKEKNVLGMVGDGAMHRMMVLSLPALRAGFEQNGKGNTAIHEFVHLLDKADGATDGLPEYMIPKEFVRPWLNQMHRTIREIRENESDLNPYAGTNEAEFFAVTSEYFFQKPGFLKEHHPELFRLLEITYKTPSRA